MIYQLPPSEDRVDQGDIIDGCPTFYVPSFDIDRLDHDIAIKKTLSRVLVLTQTCDFVNEKVSMGVVAVVFKAEDLVGQGLLKAADIRRPIRAGRVWGWYFLPKNDELGLPESIVDMRQIHTVRLDLLTALCRSGQRKARIQPLYREHLAKHFADTYSRIGLPQEYPTE